VVSCAMCVIMHAWCCAAAADEQSNTLAAATLLEPETASVDKYQEETSLLCLEYVHFSRSAI
jgi:hypothetical protein